MQTRRSARRTAMKGRLGKGAGAKAYYRSKGYGPYGPSSLVARTTGPFGVSESKYFDLEQTATAVAESTDWTGTALAAGTIALPTSGSGISQRVGNKIAIYKIAIRGIIRTVAETTNVAFPPPANRLILFVDQQTNGIAVGPEVLMDAPTTATVADTFVSMQNIDNFGRFRVLRDMVIKPISTTDVNVSATSSSSANSDMPFKMTIRFRKPLIVKFRASAGTIGDIVDNSIHLLAQKSGTGYTSNITFRTRTYYKDN